MKLGNRKPQRSRLELFDESEQPTVFGKIILAFCTIVVLAIIAGFCYYLFLKIRFFLTH